MFQKLKNLLRNNEKEKRVQDTIEETFSQHLHGVESVESVEFSENSVKISFEKLPSKDTLEEASKKVFGKETVKSEITESSLEVFAIEQVGDTKHTHLLIGKNITANSEKKYTLEFEEGQKDETKAVETILLALETEKRKTE